MTYFEGPHKPNFYVRPQDICHAGAVIVGVGGEILVVRDHLRGARFCGARLLSRASTWVKTAMTMVMRYTMNDVFIELNLDIFICFALVQRQHPSLLIQNRMEITHACKSARATKYLPWAIRPPYVRSRYTCR